MAEPYDLEFTKSDTPRAGTETPQMSQSLRYAAPELAIAHDMAQRHVNSSPQAKSRTRFIARLALIFFVASFVYTFVYVFS